MNYPKAEKPHIDSYEAFGPKDHTIKGFWAMLSLQVLVSRPV